ncbi:MAG: polyamine aminopropyltransferase [Acetobacterales bacterium]
MSWFTETLYDDWQQRFPISREVFRHKTDFQDVIIFETPRFGRVLALDGVVQTTERDEFIYHEMLAHVPVFGHGAARSVLIIGGGDGGTLREVLRHDVERATMVEIDPSVIDLCREHMPTLSDGAFDDPRAEIVVADGCAFMRESDRTFDVIMVDSTDPHGPGEVLFTAEFYGDCRKRLNPGGILATQSGVPFMQPEELTNSAERLGRHFADAAFYVAPVPEYVGGFMAFGFAPAGGPPQPPAAEDLERRFAKAGFRTKYYTPAIHRAAFALPAFALELIGGR